MIHLNGKDLQIGETYYTRQAMPLLPGFTHQEIAKNKEKYCTIPGGSKIQVLDIKRTIPHACPFYQVSTEFVNVRSQKKTRKTGWFNSVVLESCGGVNWDENKDKKEEKKSEKKTDDRHETTGSRSIKEKSKRNKTRKSA